MVLATNKTILSVTKNDRNYFLECDMHSPLGEVFDVLEEMRAHVIEIMNNTIKKEESSKENSPKEKIPEG